MQARLVLAALAAAMMFGRAEAAPACAPAGSEAAVESAIRAWFDAARRDDIAALAAIQAPGFYAFDAGKRFDGAALGDLLKGLHASGTVVEWNLHDMQAHVACDQAWISWVNTGAVNKAPVTWLESAVFRYQGGAWRMVFLHSARVPPPTN